MKAKKTAPTKENIAARLIKATTRFILPKKPITLTRTHWVAQMMASFKGLNLTIEQWEQIYLQQAMYFTKAFNKGYPVPFYGMGIVTPNKVEKRALEVEVEETDVLAKGIIPILYTNEQISALN